VGVDEHFFFFCESEKLFFMVVMSVRWTELSFYPFLLYVLYMDNVRAV